MEALTIFAYICMGILIACLSPIIIPFLFILLFFAMTFIVAIVIVPIYFIYRLLGGEDDF
jgi:hypothetical protein